MQARHLPKANFFSSCLLLSAVKTAYSVSHILLYLWILVFWGICGNSTFVNLNFF